MFSKSLSSTLLAFFMILVAFTGCIDIEEPELEETETTDEKNVISIKRKEKEV